MTVGTAGVSPVVPQLPWPRPPEARSCQSAVDTKPRSGAARNPTASPIAGATAHRQRDPLSQSLRACNSRRTFMAKDGARQQAAASRRAATPAGLVRSPARSRSRKARLRRRDRGFHQDGATLRPCPARTALPGAGAAWTLEDHNLRRSTEAGRNCCSHGARRRHARGRVNGGAKMSQAERPVGPVVDVQESREKVSFIYSALALT